MWFFVSKTCDFQTQWDLYSSGRCIPPPEVDQMCQITSQTSCMTNCDLILLLFCQIQDFYWSSNEIRSQINKTLNWDKFGSFHLLCNLTSTDLDQKMNPFWKCPKNLFLQLFWSFFFKKAKNFELNFLGGAHPPPGGIGSDLWVSGAKQLYIFNFCLKFL